MMHKISTTLLSLVLVFCINSGTFFAQEVRDLAASQGLKFGSPLQHTYDPAYEQLYRDQINVATIMTYWRYTTHQNEGEYTFDESDAAIALAQEIGAELHGHPLVWGSDVHIPDWVLGKTNAEGEDIMLEHIDTVMGRYAGQIEVWDVVNEAIEYDGTYRDSYWNRAMTGEFIIKAFRRAHLVDPAAKLLYNDYEIETNEAKFNTVKNLLGWLQSENVGLTGLGWQMHVYVDDVLDPAFPLADRMQQISDMGLDNYVTELDIRIPNNSPEELAKQRIAYQKIAEIYLANPTRGEYFQTWGLSDQYTWWNDFDTTQTHYPLPFDASMQKKEAYWGLVDAFASTASAPVMHGDFRIRNVGTDFHLSQTAEANGANVNLQVMNPDWYSQRWNISVGPAGTSRLECWWNNQYLNTDQNTAGTSTLVRPFNDTYWSMQWFLEPVAGNTFRIKNRWADIYLTGETTNDVTIQNLNGSSANQLWILEPYCNPNYTLDYPVDNGEELLINSADWINANSTIENNSDVHLSAENQVELENGFEVEQGSELLVDMEGCDDGQTSAFQLSNSNASSHAQSIYDYLNTFQDEPNQCLIPGQNLGWSFEMYNQTVAALQSQTNQWVGLIGGQMRYTSTEIDYPALVTLYTNWQAAGGICELSMLPDNPFTGGSAWDRSNMNIQNLVTLGASGYAAWRAQLDFYADVLSDMQDAGVTILWRPLMEMNGDFFWWGFQGPGTDNRQDYINLYRDMYDYFTNTKGLNNLIWIYCANYQFSPSIPTVDFYYPGADVVDITGLDVYDDNLAVAAGQYQTMLGFNKPFALTEFGPNHNNMDGSHSYLSFTNTINSAFPEAIYANAWHDWPDHLVAWISNQNATGALNLDCIVTRDEIDP